MPDHHVVRFDRPEELGNQCVAAIVELRGYLQPRGDCCDCNGRSVRSRQFDGWRIGKERQISYSTPCQKLPCCSCCCSSDCLSEQSSYRYGYPTHGNRSRIAGLETEGVLACVRAAEAGSSRLWRNKRTTWKYSGQGRAGQSQESTRRALKVGTWKVPYRGPSTASRCIEKR